MKLYGKTLKLRRGVSIDIYPSFLCNLSCCYCALKIPNGKYPDRGYEMSLQEWKDFINNFPVKIKEVCITGGEPGLWKGIAELTNWLLDEGYHVKIFSNLTVIAKFLEIKPSYRFIISATFHHGQNSYNFSQKYKVLSKLFRIDVYEFGGRVLDFSMPHKMFHTTKDFPQGGFKISPDGQILIGCPQIAAYKPK